MLHVGGRGEAEGEHIDLRTQGALLSDALLARQRQSRRSHPHQRADLILSELRVRRAQAQDAGTEVRSAAFATFPC